MLGFREVMDFAGSELTYRSLSAVRPLQENLFPLLISTLLLVFLLSRSSLGRARTLQAPWQFKATSSALPPNPNVPQPQSESAPHSHPAGFLVDLVASRMEDPPQGFSAAEFEGEAQGNIVPNEGQDLALNFAHNLHILCLIFALRPQILSIDVKWYTIGIVYP